MSYSVSFRFAPRVAHVRFEGPFDLFEIDSACTEVISSPEWRAGTPQLWDFTDATVENVSPEACERLVACSLRKSKRIGANRSAIVAHDAEILSLFGDYAGEVEPSGRRILRTPSRGQALSWLVGDDEAEVAVPA